MPNKKNPDSAELLRGKTGRVYGHLLALLTIMKATPLAYNRDFQEDKEPVFDTADTVKDCLEMMCLIIAGLKPNPDAMRNACDRGFILATDLADYLVKKGMGFRQAHHTIGTLVRYCEEQDKRLEDLTLEEFQNASKLFDRDVYRILSLETSVNSKSVIGGTSRPQVRRRIKMLQKVFKK
jgi:argininosuccinate lyase